MQTSTVVILGSTGSIGTQGLDVISRHLDRFNVVGLAAGGSHLPGRAASPLLSEKSGKSSFHDNQSEKDDSLSQYADRRRHDSGQLDSGINGTFFAVCVTMV